MIAHIYMHSIEIDGIGARMWIYPFQLYKWRYDSKLFFD